MIVAAFGLHGLDHDGRDGMVEILDEVLGFGEAAGLFLGVLARVLGQWILEAGKRCLRPVKGGDVELVDRFAAGGG